MPNKYASGKFAIAECDVCGFRYKLKELKPLVIKTKTTNILACPTCWDPDHPQLQIGMYPVEDPWAIRNPRPDSPGYYTPTGVNGGDGGSRVTQWGWNPVGGARNFDRYLTPNDLIGKGSVGSVTVTIS
jgi:hypothetical protein